MPCYSETQIGLEMTAAWCAVLVLVVALIGLAVGAGLWVLEQIDR